VKNAKKATIKVSLKCIGFMMNKMNLVYPIG
jgi:hypothetical protein